MQTSPQYSHQPQGVVEYYHQTLFAQLRTLKFSFCQHYTLDPRNISSHSPLLNHTSWLLNRYLRHNDGKTSYERNWKRPYNQNIITFGEKVYVENIMPENQKLYRKTKNKSMKQSGLEETLLLITKEQQFDKTLLLKVTSTEGEYDNSRKKTNKDKQPIPPRLYDLKSRALPYTRSKTSTTPDWNFKPPDQPILDAPPRIPNFPTFTKKQETTVQPPPGSITIPQQPILPTAEPATKTITPAQVQTPPQQQQPVRRRLATKTTPAKNDLRKEKKLSLDNMHLQEWYDDDNENYDANELKTAIKEEHDSLQKTNVFTRVQATNYDQQQLKEVIQTKWVIRSRPGGTKRILKARFVAKGFTQKVNMDEIYAATPAAITLRMLLTITQLRNHSIYMSDIQSAFLLVVKLLHLLFRLRLGILCMRHT
eukprot:4728189-Amphidinium_carterae.1